MFQVIILSALLTVVGLMATKAKSKGLENLGFLFFPRTRIPQFTGILLAHILLLHELPVLIEFPDASFLPLT
jgi:hypothetical protein